MFWIIECLTIRRDFDLPNLFLLPIICFLSCCIPALSATIGIAITILLVFVVQAERLTAFADGADFMTHTLREESHKGVSVAEVVQNM